MTLKNNYQDQQELSEFIKDKILGDSFDFDELEDDYLRMVGAR